MVQVQTMLNVADNSRGKSAQCIKIFKGKKAQIGNIILVSLKKLKPLKKNQKSKVKKGQIYRALVLRTTDFYRRSDSTYLRFSENAVLLLDSKNMKQTLCLAILGFATLPSTSLAVKKQSKNKSHNSFYLT